MASTPSGNTLIDQGVVKAARARALGRPVFKDVDVTSSKAVYNAANDAINASNIVSSPNEARFISQWYAFKSPYATGKLGSIPGYSASGLGIPANSNLDPTVTISSYRGSDYTVANMAWAEKFANIAAARQKFAATKVANGNTPVTKSVMVLNGSAQSFEQFTAELDSKSVQVANPSFLGVWDTVVTNKIAQNRTVEVTVKTTNGSVLGRHIFYIVSGAAAVDKLIVNATSAVQYSTILPSEIGSALDFANGLAAHEQYVKVIGSIQSDCLDNSSTWPIYDLKHLNRWLSSSTFTGFLNDEDQASPVGKIINIRLKDVVASSISYYVLYYLNQKKHDKSYATFASSENISSTFTQTIKGIYESCINDSAVKNAYNNLKNSNTVANYILFIDAVRAKVGFDAPIAYRF